MRKPITAFLVVAVSLLALNQGLGQTRLATAAGVDTFSVSSPNCHGGQVDVTLGWTSMNQGMQYIYWSTQNNGFTSGYTALGPLAASTSSAVVQDLPANSDIYAMIGTVVGGQLQPGKTLTFSTSGICAGGSASAGHAPPHGPYGSNFLQDCVPEGDGPYPHYFSPYQYVPFFDYQGFDEDDEDEDVFDELDEDEDDEDESDTDESDEDELDEDESDESDEDEDDEDESDESDEDESDEDEDDEDDESFFGMHAPYAPFFNPCLFFYGEQAGFPGYNYGAGFFGGMY
jgi:hypothetical protein